ncbi:hypothetical protein Tco_0168893 [Tanacetum coccineum]
MSTLTFSDTHNMATAKANTVNGERQLQALVDKKRVIITESSIRSDLQLVDAGGIDCLPTATIFEELARMGAKPTAWNKFSSTMASTIICLATNQKFNLSKYIFDAMKKQSRRKQRKETKVPQDETHHDDSVPIPSNDPLLSGRLDDAKMFDTNVLHGDEVIMDMAVVTIADEGVTAAEIDEIAPTSAPTTVIDELTLAQTLIEIKAAKPKAITTDATTTTTGPKVRGVVVQEPSEFRTTTSSPPTSQPSKTKDKGKVIMIKPEVTLKRKDQVALDE